MASGPLGKRHEKEKKTAEEKFKEASEAYSVLSDPDKKARYDQFGRGVGDDAGGRTGPRTSEVWTTC